MTRFTENLLHDLSKLLQNSDEYNMTIEAGEKAGRKKFQTHSIVLRARSPYFRRVLSNGLAKKKGIILKLKKPNIAAKIFEIILRYIYTGVVNLNEEKGADVFQLLIAADELELFELNNHTQEHLIEKESKWLQKNMIKNMHIISRHEHFGSLKEHCFQMISEGPHFIYESIDFLSLEESILVSLLQRDDLKMEEIEVWQSLIKWGIGNTPRLVKKKLASWNLKDFAALQKTVHQCIPLIRYNDISGDDYFEHVIQYKRILPKNLKKEIWAHYLKTTPQPGIHVLPPRVRSRDGFTVCIFQNLCRNLLKTVIVVKITGSGNIVGGYNPSHWGGYPPASHYNYMQFVSAADAFVFDMGNGKNPVLAKVARSTSGNQIAYYESYGPYFYNDLFFGDNCNVQKSCWHHSNWFKPYIFDHVMFQVDELEVFQVINK
ncbi:hypothetical protein G9A89_008426 [Geosiphon pyriformis]|nr:hypothetical protein G9A89_008426 [Geosiphon pyriformis]